MKITTHRDAAPILLFRASPRTGTTDTTEVRLLYKTSVTIGATILYGKKGAGGKGKSPGVV